jgi:hypothetical protein
MCSSLYLKTLFPVVAWSIVALIGTAVSADTGCGPHGYYYEEECQPAATYSVSVLNGHTRVIQIHTDPASPSIACLGIHPMLRENVDTGAVMEVPERNSDDLNIYYDDPCVPPGTYRYGCRLAFYCEDDTVGVVSYYVEHVVDYGDEGLDVEQCLEQIDIPAATHFSAEAPWAEVVDNVACIGTCEEDADETGAAAVAHDRAALPLFVMLTLIGVLFYRRSRRGARLNSNVR